jgi:hypothetical protein
LIRGWSRRTTQTNRSRNSGRERAFGGANPAPSERRAGLEVVDEPGQDRVFDVVRRGDGERHLRRGRVERAGLLHQPADVGEHLLHRRGELQAFRGRQHPSGGAQQQRVPEERAQPRERGAHRGLRQAEPRRGPGHVALAEERVERDQQVQVDRSDIHGDDDLNRDKRLERAAAPA